MNSPTQSKLKAAKPTITRQTKRRRRRVNRGLTLLEALIASVILSGMVLATAAAVSSSQQHGQFAQNHAQAALAVEAKLAEILADEYANLTGYNGINEIPGAMITAQGINYPPDYYRIGRTVQVVPATITFAELGGLTLDGYEVTVAAYDIDGSDIFSITQFIPEPAA